MSATKNLIKGFFAIVQYFVSYIIFPLWLFQYITTYDFGFFQVSVAQIDSIIYWITAIGILCTAIAFVAASSPDRSKRKGIFELLQVIFNTAYIYMYKFSGASEMIFNFVGNPSGAMSMNVTKLVYLWMGTYGLSIFLAIFDLIDYAFFKEENKSKSGAQKLTKAEEISKKEETTVKTELFYRQPNGGELR